MMMKSLRDHVETTRAIRPVLITVQEFSMLIGCCDDVVYKLIARGTIPALKVGAVYRINRDEALTALRHKPTR